ncbi:respiratory nitrate reductase chaperone NarJ [Enterobacter cancerogenus]|uniref:Respiratory nitrate reductase chaperone NarJ n=1 Tax=Enterobacter cancerogenus TaxID=69218 RepID=A0A484Z110_9ENTR|nr:respiratory nitrate reductase chaperone NarJ [Enterobacter cancerogenus]
MHSRHLKTWIKRMPRSWAFSCAICLRAICSMRRQTTASCLTVAAQRRCCYSNTYTVESRDRGQAMVDLMAQYEQHGLQLDSRELPDHLPLYLEYLAQLPKEEALGGLQDIAPILALLNARLQQRESAYAVLFELLVKLAKAAIDTGKKWRKKSRKKPAMTPHRRWMPSGKKSR